MFTRMKYRALVGTFCTSLALALSAGPAHAQFGGTSPQGRMVRTRPQHPLVTALRRQQDLLQDAARQSARLLTGLQQNRVTPDRLMRELHRQHKELKASVRQTNTLL